MKKKKIIMLLFSNKHYVISNILQTIVKYLSKIEFFLL